MNIQLRRKLWKCAGGMAGLLMCILLMAPAPPKPEIDAPDPASLSFSGVEPGIPVEKVFSVKNSGTDDLNISSIIATTITPDPTKPEFSITMVSSASSCTFTAPAPPNAPPTCSLAAGDTVTVGVTFNPVAPETHATGKVTINSNDNNESTVTVDLSGNGPCDTDDDASEGAVTTKSDCGNIKKLPKDAFESVAVVESLIVDCACNLDPNNLNASGGNQHKVRIISSSCDYVNAEGDTYAVSVEDIDATTLQINYCANWADCALDANAFGPGSTALSLGNPSFDSEGNLVLDYIEQDFGLHDLVCSETGRTVAVVGHLNSDAEGTNDANGTIALHDRYIIRCMDTVTCVPEDN